MNDVSFTRCVSENSLQATLLYLGSAGLLRMLCTGRPTTLRPHGPCTARVCWPEATGCQPCRASDCRYAMSDLRTLR